MGDVLWLSSAPIRRIGPHIALSHGPARVDDRKVIGRIISAVRDGLSRRDAPTHARPRRPRTTQRPGRAPPPAPHLSIARVLLLIGDKVATSMLNGQNRRLGSDACSKMGCFVEGAAWPFKLHPHINLGRYWRRSGL